MIKAFLVILATLAVSVCGNPGSPVNELMKDSGDLERECAGDRAAACTRVGVRRAFGTGGYERDYGSALVFLRKGCEGGDPQGCHELGVMHAHGRGTPGNDTRARELYEKGCAGGVANSCLYLGDFYRQGRSVPKNEMTARGYYDKACRAGSRSSCEQAGK